jgi:HSP20 family protein
MKEDVMADLMLWMNEELSRLKREVDSLYDAMCRDFGGDRVTSPFGTTPRVSWEQTEDHLLFRMELPGVDPADMDVSITDDRLRIHIERSQKVSRQQGEIERKGVFSSSFRLPCKVDLERVEATYREGILEIRMPPCSRAISRRLEISSR